MKYRILLKTFLISFIIFLITNSSDAQNFEKIPKDFSFKITNATGSEETSRYDSKTGIYTRQYWMRDSFVQIEINKEEMLRIYNAFTLYDFFSFPKEFECDDSGAIIMPSDVITLEFKNEGMVKEVKKSYECSEQMEKVKSKNFDKLSSLINEIIDSKPQVKKMEKTDLEFQ